ncbi:hypothetical protein [Paenibacillus sp. FSL H3-0469]|uniref:hypothetical protein n=1 Tax=Paenibacillus sp. FSL H3-0469 TaxID=2954506 RepID=UPI003101638C
MDSNTGIPRPNHGGSAAVMATWAASYVNPDSRFCGSAGLLQRMECLARFIVRAQHEDGTITLGSTNYHSPPDTGFVVVGLAQICRLLERGSHPETKTVRLLLEQFLERAVPAMLTGGGHTPNHRWVLAAALGLLYERSGDPRLADRADCWLAEGIDMTADGEWTERSNGIYNAVSNIMLYHAAATLHRPLLLDPVRRNLRMMTLLIHPNGDIVTEYSGRQDFGVKNDLSAYYAISRLTAWEDNDGTFAALADAAAEAAQEPGSVNNHGLMTCLLYPQIGLKGILRKELPVHYEAIINEAHPADEDLQRMRNQGGPATLLHSSAHTAFGSPIVRYRDGLTSVTVMTRNSSFFALRHGDAHVLGTKLTTAFLPGIVQFEQLEQQQGYTLSSTMEKGYNGPIPTEYLPAHTGKQGAYSPWYLLPHERRPMTHLQTHRLISEVKRSGKVWSIRIRSDQAEDLFTQLTFVLDSRGVLTGEGLQPGAAPGHYFLTQGSAIYQAGDFAIRIGAGAQEHLVGVIRNDRLPENCLSLSLNWLTPFDHTVELELL